MLVHAQLNRLCVWQAEKQFIEDRSKLKDAIKEHSIEVGASSSYDDFVGTLDAASVDVDSIILPNRWVTLTCGGVTISKACQHQSTGQHMQSSAHQCVDRRSARVCLKMQPWLPGLYESPAETHARAFLVVDACYAVPNDWIGPHFKLCACGCCRKLIFEELLGRAKEREAKQEARLKQARDDFSSLLRHTRDIQADTAWAEAEPLLQKDARFKEVRHCQSLALQPFGFGVLLFSPRCRNSRRTRHISTGFRPVCKTWGLHDLHQN